MKDEDINDWEEVPTSNTAVDEPDDWEEVPTAAAVPVPAPQATPEEPGVASKIWDGAKDFVGSAASAGESMVPGIGLIDKIGAASYATQQEVGDLFRDAPDQDTWENRYNKEAQNAPKQREERMDKSTTGRIAGTVAGAVPSMLLGGAATQGMGLLPSIVTGASMDGINEGLKNPDKLFDLDKASDAAESSAKMGAAVGVPLKAAQVMAPWLGKTLGKVAAVGDADKIERYAANPNKYNYADKKVSVESMVDELSPEMRKLERVLQGNLDDGKTAAQLVKGKAAQSINVAKGEAKQAKDVANQAQDLYVQNLRSTQPSAKAQESLTNALNSQRSKVGELAGEQRKIVGSSNAQIPIDSLQKIADSKLDMRKIDGVLPTGDSEVSGINQMKKLLENVGNVKGQPKLLFDPETLALTQSVDDVTRPLTPKGLVNLRQSIDRSIEPAFNAVGGRVASPAEGTGLALRKQINNLLDANSGSLPGYKANRAALAQESKLLGAASDELGNPDTAKVLSQVDPRKGGANFDTLKQLDYNNGKQVMPDLAEYLAAKGKLKMPDRLNKNLDNLPQSVAASEASKKAKLIEKVQTQKAQQAEQSYKNTARQLEDAHYADFGDLSSDKGKMEAAVRKGLFATAKNPSVKTMESLGNLSKKSGINIADDLDQLQVQSALGAQGANGSRMVNLLANMAPKKLQGVAALLGAGVDVGRGKTAKALVDAGQSVGKSDMARKAVSGVTPNIDEIIKQLLGGK